MYLRKMRWLCAGILAAVAMFASPARSLADTQILIQELDGTGSPVGASQISTGTFATFATADFQNIQVVVNSSASGFITSLGANLTASYATGDTLQVIVTGDSFVNPNPGQPTVLDNNVGASTGFNGLTTTISGTSSVFNPLTPGVGQTSTLAGSGGSSLIGPTSMATASTGGSQGDTQITNITNLPNNFAIQQTITIRASGTTSGSPAVGGTAGASIQNSPAPVPAPAGVILALTAIPALGLRRLLRRKVAAEPAV